MLNSFLDCAHQNAQRGTNLSWEGPLWWWEELLEAGTEKDFEKLSFSKVQWALLITCDGLLKICEKGWLFTISEPCLSFHKPLKAEFHVILLYITSWIFWIKKNNLKFLILYYSDEHWSQTHCTEHDTVDENYHCQGSEGINSGTSCNFCVFPLLIILDENNLVEGVKRSS